MFALRSKDSSQPISPEFLKSRDAAAELKDISIFSSPNKEKSTIMEDEEHCSENDFVPDLNTEKW